MLRQALYQVHVEQRDGSEIPIGPKMLKQYAEQLCFEIQKQIVAGTETFWSNPHLVICL
jgi:hypothetical protein